jgi:hypothetical protein
MPSLALKSDRWQYLPIPASPDRFPRPFANRPPLRTSATLAVAYLNTIAISLPNDFHNSVEVMGVSGYLSAILCTPIGYNLDTLTRTASSQPLLVLTVEIELWTKMKSIARRAFAQGPLHPPPGRRERFPA